ncbi:MAG TPA: heme o synthase [Tepidisphaeraceae bacterium]|jgi:protoheme IX farnesyltransferase
MNPPPAKLADLHGLDDFALTPAPASVAGDFVELTKARLNFMVLITTLIGFVIAATRYADVAIDWTLLLNTLIGTGMCAAGSGVLNQAWERDLDRKMTRTADRPVAAGRISVFEATQLGLLLAVCGTATLAITVNWMAAVLAAATVVLYVLVYTPLKRITTLNTLVGAIPGAVPPLVGYAAAARTLDLEAAGLFAILFAWQMPHFLAIAIMCRDDYAAAGFKMLPVVDPTLTRTSAWMVLWSLVLILASLIPVYTQPDTGLFYIVSALALGTAFLATCVRCAALRTRPAARVAFFGSIIYLPLALGALMIDRLL